MGHATLVIVKKTWKRWNDSNNSNTVTTNIALEEIKRLFNTEYNSYNTVVNPKKGGAVKENKTIKAKKK